MNRTRSRTVVLDLALEAASIALRLAQRVPVTLRPVADQLVRPASSVPSNLAEGLGRPGRAGTNHWRIAYGSAREADVQLRLLAGAGAIDARPAATAIHLLDQVRAIAWRHLHPPTRGSRGAGVQGRGGEHPDRMRFANRMQPGARPEGRAYTFKETFPFPCACSTPARGGAKPRRDVRDGTPGARARVDRSGQPAGAAEPRPARRDVMVRVMDGVTIKDRATVADTDTVRDTVRDTVKSTGGRVSHPDAFHPAAPPRYAPAMSSHTAHRINPAVVAMDESVIRDMTRVAEETGAVNLAQGFPEYPLAEPVRQAALEAIRSDRNQYTRTWGDPPLRRRLAAHLHERWGIGYDPGEELVITCGASEAIMASMLALVPRGAAVVIPEPIYENYLPATRLAGAEARILPLDPFTGAWDPARLDEACRGAALMVLNTPANPSGKVWTREELAAVAEILHRHDVLLVTDETYAHITAPGHPHVAPASVGGLWPRTVTIASFSKTYAVTGWRVGYAAAPRPLMAAIRKVHDFLTVCAPTPFQAALEEALGLPESYYTGMARTYRRRHDLLAGGLRGAGWTVNEPAGGYFLLVDVRHLDIPDDREWAVELARSRGVAGVPGSAFLLAGLPREDGSPPDRRGTFLRLSFGKREELLAEAVRRLG